MKDLTTIESALPADALRRVMDELPWPVAVINADRQIEFVNRAWTALTHRPNTDDDASSDSHHDVETCRLLGPDGNDVTAQAIDDVLVGQLEQIECRLPVAQSPSTAPASHIARVRRLTGEGPARAIITIDESSRWAGPRSPGETQTTDSLHPNGSLEAMYESLRVSAWRLAEAQRIARIGHWERDVKSGVTKWSDEVYRIFGFLQWETSPSFDAFISRVHADDRQRVKECVDHSWQSGQDLVLEFRIQHPNGEIRHLHDRAEVEIDQSGKAVRMFGTVQDVTDQKRVEARLRDQATVHSIRAAMRDVDLNQPADAVWRSLIRAIVDGFGFLGGWFAQVSGSQLDVLCDYGRLDRVPRHVDLNTQQHGDRDDASTIRAAVLNGRPFRRDDLTGYLHIHRAASNSAQPEHRSHLGIPVIVDADVTGAILFVSNQAAAFLPERMNHIQELVDEMGERLHRYRSERETAETLRRSERELLQVIAEMPVMMIAFAENGEIVAWNHECERVTGYSADEVVNQTDAIARLYPDAEYKDVFHRNWMLHSDDFRNWELETNCKDGSRRIIAWSRVSDRFPITGWAKWGIGIDVTDQRKAEDALAQSVRDYRGLFDNAHDAILIFRPEDEVVLEANPNACELYGFSRDEFIGLSLKDISHDIPRGQRKITEALQTGTSIGFETIQYRSDGAPMRLEVNAAVIEYQGNRVILTINRDVTSRRMIEESVRVSEARYRWLADHSTDVILRMSTDGTILDASRASRSVLGHGPGELVGKNCVELVTRENRDAVRTTIKRAIDEAGPHRIALRFHRHDDDARWMECLIEGLRNPEEEEVREIVAVARDMSLRKHEEEIRELRSMELSHVNRLVTLGEMAGQIAHHLHQPLTAISNYAGTMRNLVQKSGGKQRDDLEALCDEIVNSAIRTGEFIHRVRAFTQRRGLRKSRERLGTIVDNAFGLCEVRLHRMAIQKTYCEATDLPDVYLDAIQIEQVLVNLINNAIDAMTPKDAESRRLTIKAHVEPGKHVCVCVRDTGVGLHESAQQKIFQPFFTTKPDGVGLGLVISRRIIEAHGGKLWLNSHAEGGTSVFFTISIGDENDDND